MYSVWSPKDPAAENPGNSIPCKTSTPQSRFKPKAYECIHATVSLNTPTCIPLTP